MNAPSSIAPPPPPSQTAFLKIFPSIMLPMFLAVIDQTIVATALPAIARDLGGVERVSWIVIAYLVATTVAAPVYGRLGDLLGRRRLLLVALVVVMSASALCALAGSLEQLIFGRIMQGLGGGGLMTLSQALVGETIPARERGRYQGYLAAVVVCSSALGPVAGGFLTELVGWRAVFVVNLPLGVTALVLAARLPRRTGPGGAIRFDFIGLALLAACVASILLLLHRIQLPDAGAIRSAAPLLVASIASLLLLVWRERRASDPLLSIPLLQRPAIWRSNLLAACHGGMMVALITFAPIYFGVARGASAGEIGLLLLPSTIGIGIGALITGRIVSRTGRTAVFPSFGLVAVTAILFAVGFWLPRFGAVELSCVLGLNAMFMGTVMGVVQISVQTAAGPAMLGAGAASVQFSRSLGAAFGTAIVGAVLFSTLAAGDPENSRLFVALLRDGSEALNGLPADRLAGIQAGMADAFRSAFLTIAAFAAIAVALAWSLPIRRI